VAATDDEVAAVATRLASQMLAGPPARSAEGVVGRVLAVQAQDPRGFRLSVRSRSSGLLASDVDRALSAERSLIVTWLNRGTLQLVEAEDYWWLHPLTTPQLATGNQRRLREEGVSVAQTERGVTIITEAVTSEGPQTRPQLRDRLNAAGVPTAGQALVHLLFAASLRAQVGRGPMIGKEHAYVSVPAWLGAAPPELDRPEALARLARRYLGGHGPASPRDLAKWAGVTVRDARRGFEAIVDEVAPFGDGLLVLADRDQTMSRPPPRLLGPFDPLLHGWQSREPFVGAHAGVVTTNGIFRPVALVDGRVVATWGLAGGRVSIKPLEPISADALEALVEDATNVLFFLGLPDTPAVVRTDLDR
jgi:Winged helix DNA-binding domain